MAASARGTSRAVPTRTPAPTAKPVKEPELNQPATAAPCLSPETLSRGDRPPQPSARVHAAAAMVSVELHGGGARGECGG